MQSGLPARKLPDEVLLLPHPVVAAAHVRGGGQQGPHRRLRAVKDGGRAEERGARPHHVVGRAASVPKARPSSTADALRARSDEAHVRRRVRVAARARE